MECELVEAGIDIACSARLALGVRHDESDLRYALIGRFLASDADVGEGDEPTARNARAAIRVVHGTAAVRLRVEVGCEAAVVVRNLHDVGAGVPEVHIVAELDAVAQNVELNESADDAGRFAPFQFLARALTHNLHVDTRVLEEHIFVLFEVGRRVLQEELFFADWRDFPHVAKHAAVLVPNHDFAIQKRLDGLVLLVFLLGIRFAVLAGSEEDCGEEGD